MSPGQMSRKNTPAIIARISPAAHGPNALSRRAGDDKTLDLAGSIWKRRNAAKAQPWEAIGSPTRER
jgi:hypothetical protein